MAAIGAGGVGLAHQRLKEGSEGTGMWQVLCVDNAPTPPPPSPPSSCAQTTTVKSGDSCWSIYTAAGITQNQFYQLNPGINCAALQVGQVSMLRVHMLWSPPSVHASAQEFLLLHRL